MERRQCRLTNSSAQSIPGPPLGTRDLHQSKTQFLPRGEVLHMVKFPLIHPEKNCGCFYHVPRILRKSLSADFASHVSYWMASVRLSRFLEGELIELKGLDLPHCGS